MKYRIGVDVGGTFTDAVALDAATLELVGIVKVPTTHHHPNGVSEGIRIALKKLLDQAGIEPSHVAFIAHGTTQATNALLEGDVEAVAVISTAEGLGAGRVKKETYFESLELAAGKRIAVSCYFIKGSAEATGAQVMQSILDKKIKTVVVAAAYSVDHPAQEDELQKLAQQSGLNCTPTYEMSALYGLRTRTKTAILNASILPKMVETTDFMLQSVQAADIQKPLMIMRSDGGVMSAEEIKKRPIQTILSGPAAGVAGALLYAKAANGFFMEVGGTSTDISVIRNGRVMVKWAQIGPHKTYINSLDIRTVAIAGGSMLRLSGGRAVCGPRSAHIAGLPYCCFAEPLCAETLRIKRFLVPGDSAEYLVLHDDASQTDYAITLTCLANYAGVVPEKDFARGSTQNVRLALEQLSRFLEKSANVILEEAFGDYCAFLEGVIAEFEDAYGLDRTELSLIGGGGGCAAVVPILAQRLKVPYQQCPNAQIISPIGVAMAMVREVCERTIGSPSQEELLRLREEAISRAVRAGAIRDKIEVVIENEPQKNLVRAIATGVTDRRLLPQDAPRLDRAELLRCIQIQSGYRDDSLLWEGENTDFHLFLFRTKPRSRWDILFGAKREQTLFVMASDGSVKLKKAHSAVRQTQVSRLSADLNAMLDEYSEYGDMGEKLPDVFLVLGKRVLDYSMIREREPLLRLSRFETDPCERQEVLFLVFGL